MTGRCMGSANVDQDSILFRAPYQSAVLAKEPARHNAGTLEWRAQVRHVHDLLPATDSSPAQRV
jgi:hypothetical protein